MSEIDTIPKTMSVTDIAEHFGADIQYSYSVHLASDRNIFCSLTKVEEMRNGVLCGLCGYGSTKAEARKDLASRLCNKRLVYDAYGLRKILETRRVKP